MITFVYAQDQNGCIGYQNDLPWHLPSDLKFFRDTTMGHTMLMGRKTFESMGKRLLPGRKSVVMTRQADYGAEIEGLSIVHTKEEALTLAADQELMVIGGAHLYETFWEDVDKIVRTVIHAEFPCDVYMPEIDTTRFKRVKVVEGPKDEKNNYDYQYEYWERI